MGKVILLCFGLPVLLITEIESLFNKYGINVSVSVDFV